MSLAALGPFVFLRMSPFPPGLKRRVEVEARAGVDGVALWDTGRRGEPFTVQTIVDVADFDDAAPLVRSYEELIGYEQPSIIAWASANEDSFWVHVLDVRADIRPCFGVGGLNGTSQAMVTAEWTLIQVAAA